MSAIPPTSNSAAAAYANASKFSSFNLASSFKPQAANKTSSGGAIVLGRGKPKPKSVQPSVNAPKPVSLPALKKETPLPISGLGWKTNSISASSSSDIQKSPSASPALAPTNQPSHSPALTPAHSNASDRDFPSLANNANANPNNTPSAAAANSASTPSASSATAATDRTRQSSPFRLDGSAANQSQSQSQSQSANSAGANRPERRSSWVEEDEEHNNAEESIVFADGTVAKAKDSAENKQSTDEHARRRDDKNNPNASGSGERTDERDRDRDRERPRDRRDRDRERERERDDERPRDRERERDRDAHRDRGRDRERDDYERDRERERDRPRDRDNRERERDRDWDRDRERDRYDRADRERDRERERDGERFENRRAGGPRDWDRERPRERDFDRRERGGDRRDRDRDRERDGDRDRERDRDARRRPEHRERDDRDRRNDREYDDYSRRQQSPRREPERRERDRRTDDREFGPRGADKDRERDRGDARAAWRPNESATTSAPSAASAASTAQKSEKAGDAANFDGADEESSTVQQRKIDVNSDYDDDYNRRRDPPRPKAKAVANPLSIVQQQQAQAKVTVMQRPKESQNAEAQPNTHTTPPPPSQSPTQTTSALPTAANAVPSVATNSASASSVSTTPPAELKKQKPVSLSLKVASEKDEKKEEEKKERAAAAAKPMRTWGHVPKVSESASNSGIEKEDDVEDNENDPAKMLELADRHHGHNSAKFRPPVPHMRPSSAANAEQQQPRDIDTEEDAPQPPRNTNNNNNFDRQQHQHQHQHQQQHHAEEKEREKEKSAPPRTNAPQLPSSNSGGNSNSTTWLKPRRWADESANEKHGPSKADSTNQSRARGGHGHAAPNSVSSSSVPNILDIPIESLTHGAANIPLIAPANTASSPNQRNKPRKVAGNAGTGSAAANSTSGTGHISLAMKTDKTRHTERVKPHSESKPSERKADSEEKKPESNATKSSSGTPASATSPAPSATATATATAATQATTPSAEKPRGKGTPSSGARYVARKKASSDASDNLGSNTAVVVAAEEKEKDKEKDKESVEKKLAAAEVPLSSQNEQSAPPKSEPSTASWNSSLIAQLYPFVQSGQISQSDFQLIIEKLPSMTPTQLQAILSSTSASNPPAQTPTPHTLNSNNTVQAVSNSNTASSPSPPPYSSTAVAASPQSVPSSVASSAASTPNLTSALATLSPGASPALSAAEVSISPVPSSAVQMPMSANPAAAGNTIMTSKAAEASPAFPALHTDINRSPILAQHQLANPLVNLTPTAAPILSQSAHLHGHTHAAAPVIGGGAVNAVGPASSADDLRARQQQHNQFLRLFMTQNQSAQSNNSPATAASTTLLQQRLNTQSTFPNNATPQDAGSNAMAANAPPAPSPSYSPTLQAQTAILLQQAESVQRAQAQILASNGISSQQQLQALMANPRINLSSLLSPIHLQQYLQLQQQFQQIQNNLFNLRLMVMAQSNPAAAASGPPATAPATAQNANNIPAAAAAAAAAAGNASQLYQQQLLASQLAKQNTPLLLQLQLAAQAQQAKNSAPSPNTAAANAAFMNNVPSGRPLAAMLSGTPPNSTVSNISQLGQNHPQLSGAFQPHTMHTHNSASMSAAGLDVHTQPTTPALDSGMGMNMGMGVGVGMQSALAMAAAASGLSSSAASSASSPPVAGERRVPIVPIVGRAHQQRRSPVDAVNLGATAGHTNVLPASSSNSSVGSVSVSASGSSAPVLSAALGSVGVGGHAMSGGGNASIPKALLYKPKTSNTQQ